MKIIINTSQISKKAFHLIEKSQEKKNFPQKIRARSSACS
jgi:hypothetical protein